MMARSPFLRDLVRAEWMPLAGITVVSIIALSTIAPAFLTEYNLFVMLRILSVTSIFAMAQMVVIAVGQMNLSVGAIGGLVAILFGGMMEVYGVPVPLAMLIGFTIGTFTGWLNGAIIAYSGINGFVVTLAMLSVYTGLNYGITESIPFYHMPQVLSGPGTTARSARSPTSWSFRSFAAVLVGLFLFRTRPGTLHPGDRRQSRGGGAVGHFDPRQLHPGPYGVGRPGRLRRHGRGGPSGHGGTDPSASTGCCRPSRRRSSAAPSCRAGTSRSWGPWSPWC